MDSILNSDKIKVVYDNWVNINGINQALPNGFHPKIIDVIKEKAKENNNVHRVISEALNVVTGNGTTFNLSNFWGYTVRQIPYISVDEIDVNSDVIYIWPLEGSIHSIYTKLKAIIGDTVIEYDFHESINQRSLELMRLGKLKIIINIAQDPIDSIDLNRIENYFDKVALINPENVVIIPGNDCRQEYQQQYVGAKLKVSPAELLITQQYANMMFSYPRTTSLGYVSDIVREEDLDKNKLRPHKFICLNRTMKPHRYALAYYALKNELLKDNIFSFLNSFDANEESIAHSLNRFFNDNGKLWEYSKTIKEMIPYEIDTHGLTESQRCSMVADNNRKDIYSNTYINIVSETGFEKGLKPFISEKIWKPVMNLQPFVLVGNYNTLKLIKGLGFKTFSPFIDESYDEVYDAKERMQLVLREIDKLNALSIEEIHDWYYSITDILIHNKEHLKNFKDINPYQVVVDDLINTYRGK